MLLYNSSTGCTLIIYSSSIQEMALYGNSKELLTRHSPAYKATITLKVTEPSVLHLLALVCAWLDHSCAWLGDRPKVRSCLIKQSSQYSACAGPLLLCRKTNGTWASSAAVNKQLVTDLAENLELCPITSLGAELGQQNKLMLPHGFVKIVIFVTEPEILCHLMQKHQYLFLKFWVHRAQKKI